MQSDEYTKIESKGVDEEEILVLMGILMGSLQQPRPTAE